MLCPVETGLDIIRTSFRLHDKQKARVVNKGSIDKSRYYRVAVRNSGADRCRPRSPSSQVRRSQPSGWKRIPSETGWLSRIVFGLRQIKTSTTTVAMYGNIDRNWD